MLAALAVLTLVYYVTDRSLGLPPAVRVLLSLGVVAYMVIGFRRRVLYPMTRVFHRDDIAVALERRFPQLGERLISAVQLADMVERQPGHSDTDLRNQSAAMINQLVADTASSVQQMPHRELLDPRRTVRVWGIAGGMMAAVLVVALSHPAAFGVFFSRVFGTSASYPRLTTLVVELPDNRAEYRITRDGRQARITMAAGDELPVMVRAEGVVPREVTLLVDGGRGLAPRVAMTARGAARFRHVFRRVTTGFSFRASGGDDDRGDLDIEVVTVQPPRVASIRATLTPPAYTGKDPVTQSGGALEALEATKVDLQVTSTSEVASAALVFLESGREIEMRAETVTDDDGTRDILIGSFAIDRSDRFQVRLISREGMRNPHPGTYPVIAVTDHAPHGRILSPADDSLSVVLPTALIPLRTEAHDDYGLTAVRAIVDVSKIDGEATIDLLAGGSEQPVPRAVSTQFLEVNTLPLEGTAPSVGDTITVRVEIEDNRKPEAQVTKIPGQPVHVVGHADLARRIASHFRRIREDVGSVLETQTRLLDRLQGVIEDLDEGSGREDLRGDLTVVQVGQARVLSRTERIHLEFMRSFNLHLFNRLDDSPHAARVLELFLAYHVEHPEADAFLPGFYKLLEAERKAGRLGSMPKTLDPILDMTLTCARITDQLGPAAVKALDQAAVASARSQIVTALADGKRMQGEILAELQSLQDRLDEWNEFQDVIIHTRAVLDKQREIQVRTRETLNKEGK